MSGKHSSEPTLTESPYTDKYSMPVQSGLEVAPGARQPQNPYQPAQSYGQYAYNAPSEEVPGHPPVKQNPWGLSATAFGLLVALITALVVGGAVGGGVAGALSGKSTSSGSSNAATATSTVTYTPPATAVSTSSGTTLPSPSSLTNYLAPEPYYVASLSNNCESGPSMIQTPLGESYNIFCGNDIRNSLPDDKNPNLTVADFAGIFAYSLTDCLYACGNANDFVSQWNGSFSQCKGVTWRNTMAASNSSFYANCWLKNGTSTGYQCNECISAKLI